MKDFLLRAEFEDWLQKPVGGSINAKNVIQYIRLDKEPKTGRMYYDIIASFFYSDEPTYAYTVLEQWGKDIKNQVSNGASSSLKTYWNKYRQFIGSCDVKAMLGAKPNLVPNKDLTTIKESYSKTSGALYQYDGMETLVKELGYDKIIKLAVESSYFFASEIAVDRFKEIANLISKGQMLPARASNKDDQSKIVPQGKHVTIKNHLCYQAENKSFSHPIETDGNGNANVYSIINAYTGYNLAYKAAAKPFMNFIVSHIWSRAIDPRYFSNIWNIVLVPAWVNHLLDKESETGTLSSMLKATFMSICLKHYKMSKYDWPALKMTFTDLENKVAKSDAMRGSYDIQVIQRSPNPLKFVSQIKTQPIKV